MGSYIERVIIVTYFLDLSEKPPEFWSFDLCVLYDIAPYENQPESQHFNTGGGGGRVDSLLSCFYSIVSWNLASSDKAKWSLE